MQTLFERKKERKLLQMDYNVVVVEALSAKSSRRSAEWSG